MDARPPLSRITIPRRLPDLLRRERLLSFLHENVYRKLVLLSAAAGYGKTSLAIDFAHETDLPVAWLRLDEVDRDIVTLAADTCLTLQKPFPGFSSAPFQPEVQSPPQPQGLAIALTHRIGADTDRYFVLVMEDFHLVQDYPEVIHFFDTLLADLPEQAHILLTSRSLPPLNLVSLTVQQQVAGLDESHLRFNAAETQALLDLRNHVSMPAAEAEALVANTEGWITGILLTTQLMWQGLVANLLRESASSSQLYEYLATEVLHQQPEPLRQFLMESAVLPDMEPSVVDAVLERADSAHLLQQAEARRLFTSVVGDESRVYQYHHLFRDFLLARLAEQAPDRLRALQRRAAEWFAQNELPEAAVNFWLAAGERAKAAEIAEAEARAVFFSGRTATLLQWAEQFAPLAIETPELQLYASKIYTEDGRIEAAMQAVNRAALAYQHSDNSAGQVQAQCQRARVLYRSGHFQEAIKEAEIALPRALAIGRASTAALALRIFGMCKAATQELDAAETALRRAVELLNNMPEARLDLGWTLHDLAIVLRSRGQTSQVAQVQQQALRIWRTLGLPAPLAFTLNNVGWDLHMLGQYAAALKTYDEAMHWVARAGVPALEAAILTGQGDVYVDIGRIDQGAALYEVAAHKADEAQSWSMRAYALRAAARVARARKQFIPALELLRRASAATGDGQINTPLASIDALRGIILVEMGHVTAGRQTLASVCDKLTTSTAYVDLAQALLFRAFAEYRAEDQITARETLKQALSVAEQVGYFQMLVSEACATRDLLSAGSADPELSSQLTGILQVAADALEFGKRLNNIPESGRYMTGRFTFPSRARIQVTALGASKLRVDGREIGRTDWETQLSRELLLLLIDQSPLSREDLLKTFWLDKPPARASANLRQAIYRLRRVLGPDAIQQSEAEYRLAPELDLDYDVARFERAARPALAKKTGDLQRSVALAEAIGLYHGEYLADLPVGWASHRRQELGEQYIALLCAYADELMNLMRYGEAREIVARALGLEPLRDDLHERMLVCLAALGRRHEVVDHYRRYRTTLRDELGLDPPPELRTLYSRLIH